MLGQEGGVRGLVFDSLVAHEPTLLRLIRSGVCHYALLAIAHHLEECLEAPPPGRDGGPGDLQLLDDVVRQLICGVDALKQLLVILLHEADREGKGRGGEGGGAISWDCAPCTHTWDHALITRNTFDPALSAA